MNAFMKTVWVSVLLCLAFCGRSAWADPITVDLPDLVGDFVHGDAPISATALFEDVSGSYSLSSLLIQITATGTPGFSEAHGELPAEIVVSATDGGPALISPTVLGPYGETSITLEAFNGWGTLDGDLDGTLTSGIEITVTLATNDVYSSLTTAPVVHITSATLTATFDPINCGWMGCDGFVGLGELDIVLGNWNRAVVPGDFLSGDYNNDGFVGLGDLDMVLVNWNAGTPPATGDDGFPVEPFWGLTQLDNVLSNWNRNVEVGNTNEGDYVADGFVGIEDLDVVLGNWNAGAPPAAAVPEPGAMVCMVAGAAAVLRRRA